MKWFIERELGVLLKVDMARNERQIQARIRKLDQDELAKGKTMNMEQVIFISEEIIDRWRRYFENLLNREYNDHNIRTICNARKFQQQQEHIEQEEVNDTIKATRYHNITGKMIKRICNMAWKEGGVLSDYQFIKKETRPYRQRYELIRVHECAFADELAILARNIKKKSADMEREIKRKNLKINKEKQKLWSMANIKLIGKIIEQMRPSNTWEFDLTRSETE
ncbi:hypothetical protein FQA39_LY12194 [Lamprigera yunnana]|nr:hypothetical protein FQA39_LY12194 [Lamprigera yunnana]